MAAQGTARQLLNMSIERISLRSLISGMLLLVVFLSIAHTIIAKRQFRDAAVDFRVNSLTRLVEAGSTETLRQARNIATAFGSSLQQRLPMDLTSPGLVSSLDETFIKGFVGARDLDLVKLRIYDSQYRYLTASTAGVDRLPPVLAPVLANLAQQRQGVDRFKIMGGLWTSPHGSLYSVLIPIGGLKLRGYLEVVFNPLHNLRDVARIINMPLGIQNNTGAHLLLPDGISLDDPAYVPVTYTLRYSDDKPALLLAGYEKVDHLYGAMHRSQIVITLIYFASILCVLMLVFWLLHRYLFQPVHDMIQGMELSLHNEQATALNTHAVKELHIATKAFNAMSRKVAAYIATLQRLSIQDGLTGIANRRHFDMTLDTEWQRAARHGSRLSLVLIDIDFFKQYNDNYGHQAGDQCLREIASCLNNSVQRAGDLVARYGGEEFVALLQDCDETGAGKVARRLQQAVIQMNLPHKGSAVADYVTLSLGVCTLSPRPGDDHQQFLARADDALYRAKRKGRNRVEIAEKIDAD